MAATPSARISSSRPISSAKARASRRCDWRSQSHDSSSTSSASTAGSSTSSRRTRWRAPPADARLGGQADELVGMLDLAQRYGEQVAHEVAADVEQRLGAGVVGEGGDGAVVLDEHAPGEELAQGGDEGPPVGLAVGAELDAGFGGRRGGPARRGRTAAPAGGR